MKKSNKETNCFFLGSYCEPAKTVRELKKERDALKRQYLQEWAELELEVEAEEAARFELENQKIQNEAVHRANFDNLMPLR